MSDSMSSPVFAVRKKTFFLSKRRQLVLFKANNCIMELMPKNRVVRELPIKALENLSYLEQGGQYVVRLEWDPTAPTQATNLYVFPDEAEQQRFVRGAIAMIKTLKLSCGGNWHAIEEADKKTGEGKAPLPPAPSSYKKKILVIVLLGASGDLAKKKIYPVLWSLFKNNRLPPDTLLVGYARSKLTHEQLVKKISPYLKVKEGEKEKLEAFLKFCEYFSGTYDDLRSFEGLNTYINRRVDEKHATSEDRLFYLALPPSVFQPVTTNLKEGCMAAEGWTRITVEKPFGRDTETFAVLDIHMSGLFQEEQVFRIDHYLGKEMVQNLLPLRFSNPIFSPLFHEKHVQAVIINFKEPIGTQGRGGYFDQFGIIRDVMQNHLLQILTLIGMEKPISQHAEAVRDEKVRLLKCVQTLRPEDVVLGQYVGNPIEGIEESTLGYCDDDTVPKGSKTPTFAAMVFRIHTERWDGVPFIMKAGKALNERKVEVRIQFKEQPANIFTDEIQRNELVMRVQPNEAIYYKMMVKQPGMTFTGLPTDLDLTYSNKFQGADSPDAYERLVRDAIDGSTANFVRRDELKEAWRIFTPLLHTIDAGNIEPIPYKFGSRGPTEADELIYKSGYKFYGSK